MTLSSLAGGNAFTILGTVSGALKRLEREVPNLKGLSDRYMKEATAGDYDHLCEVTERYALKYLPDTFRGKPGDLTDGGGDDDDYC